SSKAIPLAKRSGVIRTPAFRAGTLQLQQPWGEVKAVRLPPPTTVPTPSPGSWRKPCHSVRASAARHRDRGTRPRRSLQRDEDAVAQLGLDGFGEMALAVRVLDQKDLTGADPARLAVARGDLNARVEVDDVLAPWRGVPVEIVVGLDLPENDAGGGDPLREPSGPGRLRVL